MNLWEAIAIEAVYQDMAEVGIGGGTRWTFVSLFEDCDVHGRVVSLRRGLDRSAELWES